VALTLRVFFVVILLLVALSLTGAHPLWGTVGHQTTATIAQYFLSAQAQAQAEFFFPNVSGQLEVYATWADSVRYKAAYAWSAPLHYIDTPDWSCVYDPKTDCPNSMCVAGAILNYTNILLNTKSSKSNKIEALKFLVHFHGDIHQPLHVGFTTDLGGNTIKGNYDGSSTNLHSVWDTSLISTRVTSDFGGDAAKYVNYLVDKIRTDWKSLAAVWESCNATTADSIIYSCPNEWAQESAKLACEYSYTDQNGNVIPNGFNLQTPYFDFVKDIVDMQLAKGGVRLAATLNKIWAKSK